MNKISENTTVIVSKETRDALKAIGSKGETYDAVLRRLLQLKREYEETGGLKEFTHIPDIEKEAEG